MKINTIGYLIKDGFKNLWTSRKTTIASFIIIVATMLMLGIFVLITVNIENIIKKAQDEQGIQVMLLDIDKEETDKIEEQLKNIYSVKSVEYISKQQALESVVNKVDDKYKQLYTGFEEENPLPASFIVKLEDLEQSTNIQNEIKKIPNVKEIQTVDNTTQLIVKIAKAINIVGIVILIVLLCISVFIISNSIKITMYARRKEISIMKYVGATDGFVRFPFIVEGMIIGIFGAAIATAVVGIAYSNIYNSVNSSMQATNSILSGALVPFSAVSQSLILIYIALGVGIGVIGSTMSIKKYLDV